MKVLIESKKVQVAGWLFGFFVVLAPIDYMIDHSPISALIKGIIGVGVAVVLLSHGGKRKK